MGDPRGFLKFERETPDKRPPNERIHDWKEFYRPMGEETLRQQASRCMDCGVPFCQSSTGCPVENDIPDWNDLVFRGKWDEALEALHETNNFPEFTGTLCPAPCESACVLGINSDPVSIRNIELNIIEHGFSRGAVRPILAPARTGKRVAVVGSGPAGLAAAQQLARAGHSVTVYEKADRIGGLLRYGIPEFKMEKAMLDRRLAQLRAEGVEFRTGVSIGGEVDAEELVATHDAVCLAIGAEAPRDLVIPGRELRGIHFAMDYLTQQNRVNEGDAIPAAERIDARGKRVVVIGGGDTGSDCLGTALRQGALEVHQFEILPQPPLERARSTPWPLWPMQLRTSHAHEEGGERVWSVTTTSFRGEGGKLAALRAQHGTIQQGRFEVTPGTQFELPADLVLLAMGFTGPVRGGLVEKLGLKVGPRGAVATDGAYRTNRRGVFAAGDMRMGASLIVHAIAEGRKMAANVNAYLEAQRSQPSATQTVL